MSFMKNRCGERNLQDYNVITKEKYAEGREFYEFSRTGN